MKFQWGMVAIVAFCLSLAIFILHSSSIYRLYQLSAVNAFVNGVPTGKTATVGQSFPPHLLAQIKNAAPQIKDSSLLACLPHLADAQKTSAILYALLEQVIIEDLSVCQQDNHIDVSIKINAQPPFQMNYYFTQNGQQIVADSVRGVDRLLVYLQQSFIKSE